ncbi:MAG: cytochrome bc1 complex diheme cytochrome c subunit [Actinomycetes bacterium]
MPRRIVRRLSVRRRTPVATFVLLFVALVATGGLYTAFAPAPQADASAAESSTNMAVAKGSELFKTNCASCHGLNAQGSAVAPSLIGVGAASVDFQVGTGRMPAENVGPQVIKHKVLYSQTQIDQLAAYVASLAPGPAVPSEKDLDLSDADLSKGGEIFRTNCSMCHNFVGSGGALTGGKYAPSLKGTSPKHIWEAMVTGPQSMPVFSNGTITPDQKRDVIAWLKKVDGEAQPGGASLGQVGPVTEGAVAWIVGIGGLIGAAVWLGAKAK